MSDTLRLVHRERKMLCAHAPELHNKEKALEFYCSVLRAGREYGFSQSEMESIKDHRVMLLFKDAMTHLGLWKDEAP